MEISNRPTARSRCRSITITVNFHRHIPSKEFYLNPEEKITCEDITWQCLSHVRDRVCPGADSVGNHSQHLAAFGLLDEDIVETKSRLSAWYPSNHVFEHSRTGSRTCKFCVRFCPNISKYEDNKENIVWEYFILQCLEDLLQGYLGKQLGELSKDRKSLLMKLCVSALLIPMELPLKYTKRIGPSLSSLKISFRFDNYFKHFSKELFRSINSAERIIHRFSDYFFYYSGLKNEILQQLKNQQPLGYFKIYFISHFLDFFPQYGFDRFAAKSVDEIGNLTDFSFFIKVYNYNSEQTENGLYYGDHVCKAKLNDVDQVELTKPIASDPDLQLWKIHIDLNVIGANNSLLYMAYKEKEIAENAICMLQGYIRLCINPDCNFKYFTPPSTDIRKELKSFGHWSSEKAQTFLDNSNNMKPPSERSYFLLYQDLNDYKRFNIAIATSDTVNDKYWVEWVHNQKQEFHLKTAVSSELFTGSNDLRIKLKQLFGIQLVWREGKGGVTPVSIYSCVDNQGYDTLSNPVQRKRDVPNNGKCFTFEDLVEKRQLPEIDPLLKRLRVSDREGNQYMLLSPETKECSENVQKTISNIYVELTRLNLSHNLIQFYGPVYRARPHMAWLFEHTSYGSLNEFLKRTSKTITTRMQMRLAHEVVKIILVLEQLMAINLYHGNIRGQNFYIFKDDSDTVTVKLGDPGLFDYYDNRPNKHADINDERRPWLAPERWKSIHDLEPKVTKDSEIYSFGTTIFEILCKTDDFRTLFKLPQSAKLSDHFNGKDLDEKLKPPALKQDLDDPNCPSNDVCEVIEDAWKMVKQCWDENIDERPDRKQLTSKFSGLVAAALDIKSEKKVEDMLWFTQVDTEKQLIDFSPNHFSEWLHTHNKLYLEPKFIRNVDGTSGFRKKELGQGFYGKVYKAQIQPRQKDNQSWQDVAIKECKSIEQRGLKEDFEDEIKMTAKLRHENVVAFLYVSKDIEGTNNYLLIIEFMPDGSLSEYVKNNQAKFNDPSASIGFIRQLQRYLLDVAKGMVYLSGCGVVHRDLATRNVLLGPGKGNNKVAKICDFGLAKTIHADHTYYYVQKDHPAMTFNAFPPEYVTNLLDKVGLRFRETGDVWLFGITVWETFNPGIKPSIHILDCLGERSSKLENINMWNWKDILAFLKKGKRLPKSVNMSDALSNIVYNQCWKYHEKERPRFVQLEEMFKQLLNDPKLH